MCANCDDEAPYAAHWGCVECFALLCDGCKILAHTNIKLLKSHRILSVEDFRKHRARVCSKHANEEIASVCDDCGVLVCTTGASTCHSTHATLSLAQGITRERSKLEQSLRDAQKLIENVQTKIETFSKRVADNCENTTKLHEHVETDRARLVETINSRAAAAHEEIESWARTFLRLLEAEREEMDGWLSRASSCMEASRRALEAHCTVPEAYTECRALRTTCTTLIQEKVVEGRTENVRKVGDTVAGTAVGMNMDIKGAMGEGTRKSVCDMQLSIIPHASKKITRLVETLFAIEEVAEAPVGVHPITRLEGGIIGSAVNLSNLRGITLHSTFPASGLPSVLFVCDCVKNQVQVFDANLGTFIRSIGVMGAGVGQLYYPSDVVLRTLSYGVSLLYVSDQGNKRVQVFDAESGAHVRMLGVGEVGHPEGLALHVPPSSQLPTLLFIACFDKNIVKVVNADTGSLVRTIGPTAASGARSSLREPLRLAVRRAPRGSGLQTLLYVTEYGKHHVKVFDADTGALVHTIGTGVKGAGHGQLDSPWGLALQESAPGSGAPCLLYVADNCNHRIQVFDADTGTHVHMIGAGTGSAVGQLNCPIDVCLHPGPDGSTLLFVSESGNKRVQVFVV